MLKKVAHPATLIALVALFAAGTGGAFAAGRLITSRDIANHSIQLVDLSPAAIAALRGHNGAIGATGPAGANGTFDPTKLTRVVGDTITVQPGANGTALVGCPTGQYAVGGGGYGSIAGLASSTPIIDTNGRPVGWYVVVSNGTSVAVSAYANAVCAAP